MPESKDEPENPRTKREAASRAWRLSLNLSVAADQQRLRQRAEDLEQEASQLEEQTVAPEVAPSESLPPKTSSPVRTPTNHVKVPVQEPPETGLPSKEPEDSPPVVEEPVDDQDESR